MADNPTLSRDLVADARSFLKDRQIMASVSSEADLQAAGNIYKMNERTHTNTPQAGGAPQIPHERRNENLLGAPDSDPQATPG